MTIELLKALLFIAKFCYEQDICEKFLANGKSATTPSKARLSEIF